MLQEQERTDVPPKMASNPSMADIHHYLSKAIENRGEAVEIFWSSPGSEAKYRLKVQCSTRGSDAEWSMYTQADDNWMPIWTYISCDVLLVYNLVTSSCQGAAPSPPQFDLHGMGADRISRTDIKVLKTADSPAPAEAKGLSDERADANSRARIRGALNGDLSHVQISTILQSILMAQMTGCLIVKKGEQEAEIYFVAGTPTHAQTENTVGEETLFELLSWKVGQFHFEPDKRSDAITITLGLESLLLQGMQLIDHEAYLANARLKPNSIIAKRHSKLAEAEFEALVGEGAPLPLPLQKRFYKAIDGHSTVEALVNKLHLPRSSWVPIVCNLLRADLLAVSNGKDDRLSPILEPKTVDRRAIQNVMMSLRRPDTGMFTYPAFLYFLEQEYFRAYRSASPISVVVFQMRTKSKDPSDPVREPLSLEAIGEAVRRISRVKRHVDLLAHYETFDYAMLLPNTKSHGTEIFCNRIIKALMSSPLAPGIDSGNLSLAFGAACIPDDALDLSMLLSAAEVAKNIAQHNDSPLVSYKDLR